jgi:sigma-B regulation protein RsbU (phosphoserine phosphatase)
VESKSALTEHKITVLLIDDQPLVGEAVRRMLVKEPDIVFHFCKDPAKAAETAATVKPTVILQDLIMPDIDGLTLVKQFREQEGTRDIPMIVLSTKEEPKTKAEAFALGANDYMVKLPDPLEVLARIRYHSRGYINYLQRNEAFQKLEASQRALAQDVAEAANYVKSLLPPAIKQGPIRTAWKFIPSTDLGGDAFGYHELDSRYFACYLLDVCGHGVGAALLSVSVLNALRSQSLPQTDFRKPDQVLTALNKAFPMEQQNGKFFTIWYGVIDRQDKQLIYSGGGHPPSVLLSGSVGAPLKLTPLKGDGLMVGAVDGLEYSSKTVTLEAVNRLYLYSDGAVEIHLPDGSTWTTKGFLDFMAQPTPGGVSLVDHLIDHITKLGNSGSFADDVSVLELAWES